MKDLAQLIDHTALKADVTEAALLKLCQEARTHNFYAVCVNSRWIPAAVAALKGSPVLPITVVGFPLGASLTAAKAAETQLALEAGAKEIDMVLDVGALKSGHWKAVEDDVGVISFLCKKFKAPLKVILETSLLTNEEIRHASESCVDAGADFVKTSTGFGSAGATVEHVRIMREAVGPALGVKASGGIKTLADVKKLVEAGANRIGTSNAVAILAEWKRENSK